jgi:hypothetical protein
MKEGRAWEFRARPFFMRFFGWIKQYYTWKNKIVRGMMNLVV